MIEQVTLEVARRLFAEAANFTSGRTRYMCEDSEIRKIAEEVFRQSYVMHLDAVCNQIYYVLACEFMRVPEERNR